MEAVTGGYAFDGTDLAFVRLGRQHQAAADEGAIEPDRAGPALALLAGVLRTVETKAVPQEGEQAGAGPRLGLAPVAVDLHPHNHAGNLRSSRAQVMARRASTRHPCRRKAAVPRTPSTGLTAAATSRLN